MNEEMEIQKKIQAAKQGSQRVDASGVFAQMRAVGARNKKFNDFFRVQNKLREAKLLPDGWRFGHWSD